MKKHFYIILLLFPLLIQSQEFIKGKLITSQSFKNKFPLILASIDGFIERKVLDDNGSFQLRIEKEQPEYTIHFNINDSIVKTYIFKHSWTKRKRFKLISFSKKCDITIKNAIEDRKNDCLKLYVYQEEELTEEDLNIQLKYNFTYILITNEDILNFDCYKKYNHTALRCFILDKDLSRNIINKNTIGIGNAIINGPCLK